MVALKESIDLLLVTLQTEIAALDAEKKVLEEEKAVLDSYMLELSYSQQSLDAMMTNKVNTLATLENQQSYTEEQKAKDLLRTDELKAMNLTVLRICNTDIDRNFRGVCEYINLRVNNSLPQSPSVTAPSSEGAG